VRRAARIFAFGQEPPCPQHRNLWSGSHAIHVHQLPASTLYVVTLVVVVPSWMICRELIGFARAGWARQAR